MVIQYIGRTTTFKGKPLWEILGNLKNFGVGRLVYRHVFQRYPEPSYMRILKVQAQPDPGDTIDEARKVTVLVERVFRGVKSPKPIQLDTTTYKADYVLIPKDEEHKFLENKLVQKPSNVLPATMPLPPLFSELIKIYQKYDKFSYPNAESGGLIQIPIIYGVGKKDKYKIAKTEEEATIAISPSLGKSISPKFHIDNMEISENKENRS